jgi:regulator of nucleoside diphosphate kinase
MTRRKIHISETDRQDLHELLGSEFANAIAEPQCIDDLRSELARAVVIRSKEIPEDVVTMNSTVTLRDLDTNQAESYTLVFPSDADIANNRLSVLAPVGTAILGQRVGDRLRWRVPAGWRRLVVEQVHYQPEREGVFNS